MSQDRTIQKALKAQTEKIKNKKKKKTISEKADNP